MRELVITAATAPASTTAAAAAQGGPATGVAGTSASRIHRPAEVSAMPNANPDLDRATATDPEVARAVLFASSFLPKPGVDYGWLDAYAKEVYLHSRAVLKSIDDKATAIINYLASGAGLFTLGSLAGVATAKVPAAVIACSLPSMACAVAAIIFAAYARTSREIFPPGGADQAVAVAEFHGTEEAAKRAGLLFTQWHLLTALLGGPLAAKGWDLMWANRLFVLAIALLLLPLVASLLAGAGGPAPQDVNVTIVNKP